jgi:hypothetical protein
VEGDFAAGWDAGAGAVVAQADRTHAAATTTLAARQRFDFIRTPLTVFIGRDDNRRKGNFTQSAQRSQRRNSSDFHSVISVISVISV